MSWSPSMKPCANSGIAWPSLTDGRTLCSKIGVACESRLISLRNSARRTSALPESGDGAEVGLEHSQPEHGVDGGDHLGHAEDQRLARIEQVLGRFEARLRRRIGDAPHRRRDQRLQVGDLCACAVEAEQQPHQQLAGADQHRGAVARHPVGVVVHRDDAAGAGLVLHDDGGLALDVAGEPVGDHAAVEIAAAAGRKADQHLELLALEERRLRVGWCRGQRKQERTAVRASMRLLGGDQRRLGLSARQKSAGRPAALPSRCRSSARIPRGPKTPSTCAAPPR